MSDASTTSPDVTNAILGVSDGTIIDLRDRKPVLAEELQAYYDALFEPDAASAAAFPLADRAIVAVRVAAHTRSAAVVAWYERLARGAGVSEGTLARARDVESAWTDATPIGAAIRHADLLTLRPADAEQADLQALKEAGFSPAGILSLSQTIAFVSYQLRLIAGLRALGEAS